MKKYLLVVILLLLVTSGYCQQINEEKVNKAAAIMKKMISNPDQMMSLYQQMQALQLTPAEEKEAQKRAQQSALKEADNIKQQAESVGGKSAQQIQQVREQNNRLVPVRDEARINSVLKRTLTDADIKLYCKAVHESIKKQLLPQATEQAEKIFTQIKAKSAKPDDWGKDAVATYLSNLTLQSLYIMGRICSESTADANTLNNYAALLNGVRMEHGAIPILNYLRTKYGASPPVMNNLAMAWLGLGEFQKAGKIADTVIQRFPGRRGQAHYVKAIIKENSGDRNGAVEEMKKSLDESYSVSKAAILRKWNASMKSSDFKGNPAGDVLGLNKFEWPPFPKTYEELLVLQPAWQKYKAELQAARDAIEAKEEQLRQRYQQSVSNNSSSFTGFAASAGNNVNQRMEAYYNSFSEDYADVDRELLQEKETVEGKIKVLFNEMQRQKKAVDAKYTNFCGEGQKCPEQEICEAQKKVYDAFLKLANEEWRLYFERASNIRKRYINHMLYGARYSMDDAYFPVFKMQMQMQYLAFLQSFTYETTAKVFQIGPQPLCIGGPQTNPFKKGLPDFDEVNCKNKWFMSFPGGHELSTECNKLTFKVNFLVGSVARTENLVTGEWTEFEIEAGLDIGSKEYLGGALEAGAEVGSYIKIDRSGINDWGLKGGAAIKMGMENVKIGSVEKDLSVKAIEVSGKLSMVSGKAEVEISSDFSSNKIEFK